MTAVSPHPANPSPASQPVTDSPRLELMIGGAVIALFFIIFLGWAAFAPLDAGAFAQGQVSISGNRQAVQHREGGIVSALHVAEGDRVQQGQVLIELSTGELAATERGVAGQVVSLLAQRARMVAERDRLPAVATPPEFATLIPEDRPLANEAMRLQRLQFAARRSGRSTETGVLGQRIGQLDQQRAGLERQIASNVEQRRLIEEELDGIRELAAKGFAPQNRVRALERTAAALDGELGSLRAQVASTGEAVGQTRLEMLGVSTKMNEDVADQLRQAEVALNELRPKLVELRSQMALSRIRAPATGQVVGLTVFTVGGVIAPGQVLMDVVPDNASQVIVASIKPTDVDNLRLGQSTEVKFPGLRDRSTPILHGTVERISPDSFTDEKTGQSHYRAEVVISPAELRKLGASARHIRPGMPVEVVVLLRKRTALQYLVEPLVRSLWRTGSEE
ncbi:HlyD family type I secretion periplasmic adaptor subunit [Brevundimonas goettingensis]|uniref:Membrane fusion protein (MFP) family protein n=1 Tax=Brevundimonas goettingensis TaxID=2774190 RepID=A0A975GVY6_9CAUL|nr:HlyD family type I secretion periplasmic adaptor subunit [Brevundimonas goettingensis]QTC91193.1 HlyD family type I secretion periplasmic adaptor subunit [Brevundimonas goettingensis]